MRRGGRPIRPPRKDTTRINERIRVPTVRVVDEEGNQVGVLTAQDAMALARERGLDLVEVSANSSPPVCRIMDYGKFKYEQKKKQAKAKKVQHRIQVKEVKFRIKIDEHDFDFKVNHAREFLEQNNKVKFIVQFRGREVAHAELGEVLLKRAAADLEDVGQLESPARREGHTMTMYMMPRKDRPKPKKVKESPAEEAQQKA